MAWLFSKALIDSANLPCSQGQAAGFSPDVCSDGELYVPSSSTSTPLPYSWRDKTTAALSRFRSGMTFALSTEQRGADVLTSFLAAFHALTSVPLAKAPESKARNLDSGVRWPASLAKYDPASRSWKTRQGLLAGGLAEFSETWPKWGMTRDGDAWRLRTPSGLAAVRAYITSAKGSGLSAKKIPTPHGLSNNQGQGGGEFDKAVRKLGTVTAASKVRSKEFSRSTQSPREMVNGGQLNPMWTEWFMGWPIGWTGLGPLATDKFQAWLDSHGES